MPRAERQKGKRGELEVRDLLRKHGFECERDGRLEDDLQHNIAGYHFEVKRRETIEVGKWTRQAEADAGERVACVAYRRSNEPWRAILTLDDLLALLALVRDQQWAIENLKLDGLTFINNKTGDGE